MLWFCRYNTHGSMLYTACERGVVRRYCRWPDHHGYLDELYRHKGEIQDMDISPYDECILALVLVANFQTPGKSNG